MQRFAQQWARSAASPSHLPKTSITSTITSPSPAPFQYQFGTRFTPKRSFSNNPPQPTASIAEHDPYATTSVTKAATTPSQPPPEAAPSSSAAVPPTPTTPTPPFFQRHPWVIGQLVTTLPLLGVVGYQQMVINEIVSHTRGVEDAVEQFSDILEYHHNVIGEMVEFPDEYYDDAGPGPQGGPPGGYSPQSRFPSGGAGPGGPQFRPPSPPPSMQTPLPPQPTTSPQQRQPYQSRSNLFAQEQGGPPVPPTRDQQRVQPYQ